MVVGGASDSGVACNSAIAARARKPSLKRLSADEIGWLSQRHRETLSLCTYLFQLLCKIAVVFLFQIASTVAAATDLHSANQSASEPHRTYPFANAHLYVDPDTAAAEFVRRGALPYPVDVMKRIADEPAAIWLTGRSATIFTEVAETIARSRERGTMPVFTAYKIPHRDCGGHSSGGASAAEYATWIERIAQGIGAAKAAIVIEPDALAQIHQSGCLTSVQQSERYQLLKYAVATLRRYAPNTAIYLDAGNPGWISATTMAKDLGAAGIDIADGFALNVANFYSVQSNIDYGMQLSALVGGKHFVIDTGRNGSGPTADFDWCNPPERALGPRSQGFSSGVVDAFLWIKRPGNSDGRCHGGPPAGVFWPEYAFDLANRAQPANEIGQDTPRLRGVPGDNARRQ